MEACSEGHENKNKPLEEENRVKRKKKTPSQLEILEKTYAMETYPSEATRGELAVKLGLSDRQLQMWFCHRRQKDRKAVAPAGPSSVPMRDGVVKIEVTDVRNVSDFVSDLRPIGGMDLLGVVPLHEVMGFRRMGAALSEMDSSSSHEPHQTLHELQAIAFVESQLGESLRDDGPILGMEFDSVPLGAFGAPLEAVAVGQCRQPELSVEAKVYESLDKGVSKILHEYQFIPEQPTVKNEISERVTTAIHFSSLGGVPHSRTSLSSGAYFLNGNESAHNVYGVQGQKIPDLNLLSQSHQGRSNHLMPSASGGNDDVPRMNPFVDVTLETQMRAHQVTPKDGGLVPFDSRVIHEEEFSRFQRKRKNEEARMQRELEVQEKRIRKELVKQEILRQKREEQIKKEMERHDRERQKEEERLLRERQREEERFLREQRREQEQREKFLQKESIRIEKLRQKEELQRVKEAARIKAASERAVARRMVKDAMDLIEDERLELMELAASKKGLSSILALDYETMQNLESYRDGQTSFPPKSVQLKRAFSIQPWSDSDENVGNLLMVWRFLITFADILGIWPFTLDELIQAFHDYDPRILGEIHIALLRSIIKDIEDVARTPTTGLGGNQNSYTNSGGGHPQVVEGAYVWGFDIRNWQRHLNPLTWPEILRQFALSAGFGPQLKKHNIEQVHPSNNEVNDGKDIISNLRSGAAVENAVAIMQEKGLSNPRRHKHRLTPGTVKYAAFYVLALEGNRGLNILEIADKIQKSGLRDLTTSKSPEAAIASALSRDTELFERTAPSTYCVRPVYRKDPADSEAIFSAARERIRIFTSGFVGAEVADDGERDEDCESVMAKDPEIDDLGAQTNTKKEVSNFKEFNANTVMRSGKDNGEILQTRDSCREKVDEGLGLIVVESFDGRKDVRTSSEIAVCSNDIANPILKSMDVDENTLGEPWVQGLTEGEYSDLSVEERLHALVALITVTNEGNSIRVALEERLEAANALKKQMLAEAQLDKRHIKEDSFVKMQSFSYLGNKNEPAVTFPSLGGKQCPSHTVDVKNDKALLTPCGQREQIALQENQNPSQNSLLEVNMQSQDCSTGPDNYSIQQSIYAAEKARSNLKSYIDHLAEQTYMYRSLPLGLDRRRNRYWQFVTSASQNDPGAGRIFVELHDGCWKLIDSVEGFDALLVSLDLRGIRESHLHMMLQRIETSFKESVRRNVQNGEMIMQKGDTVKNLKKEAVKMAADLDCSADINCPTSVCIDDLDTSVASTSFTIQLGRNEIENKDAYMKYWDFEKWMRKECLNCSVSSAMKYGKKRCKQLLLICDLCGHVYFFREVQCPLCHRIFSTSQGNSSSYEHIAQSEGKMNIDADFFHDSSSSSTRMRLLKILLSVVEVTLPQEALQPFWTERYRKSWSSNLEASSSTEDILQMLTALEGAIKREYLASDYETTNELLDSVCSSGCLPNDIIGGEKIPVLPWVPFTTAAVALRLMDLDACIFYTSQQKQETKKDSKTGIVVKLPLKCAAAKNSCDGGAIETSFQTKHTVKNWGALGAGLESYNKGQRTRQGCSHSRGQRSQGIVTSSRSNSKKRSTTSNSRKEGRLLGWKGTPNGQGHTRGRRSIRSRKKPAAKMDVITSERGTPKDITELTAISAREEIDGGTEANALNARNSERSEYEDDVCQATRDKYDFVVDNNNNGRYQGGFSGNPDNLIEQNHYNVDDEEVNLHYRNHITLNQIHIFLRSKSKSQTFHHTMERFHHLLPLLPLLLLTTLPTTFSEIRFSEIRSDDRPIIPFDQFGFTHNGILELNVSKISLSNSNLDLSKVGFFLCTLDSWLHVLQQLEDGEIRCALQSDLVKSVFTFSSLNGKESFNTLYNETDSDQYNLVFANCHPQQLKVSMDVNSAMYNLDGKSHVRDYLSAGRTILPRVYFVFSLVYFTLAAVWISVLYKKRLTAFRIHYFMLAVIILKAINLLCEAEDKSYIKRTGSAHGWDILFYMFSFLKGISLFTLIVLIGTGWSFLKPFLQDKEKKVLMIVIPLQIVANIAQVVIDESGPYGHDWVTWKQIFLLVDVVCCCAVLFPIVWSIKNLREAARTDGKAAVNLMKLTLFRHYYIVVIFYIYFTRVVVYALETITSYRYSWTSVVAAELATLAFYVFTGYKFKPEAHNPYFVIDDEEEEAAAEALKLEDEFEL